jgi:hypothetical protein
MLLEEDEAPPEVMNHAPNWPGVLPIYAVSEKPPPFHPLVNRDAAAPYPATDLTARVLHLRHVWDEMRLLIKLSTERDDPLESAVLYKHALITLKSIFHLLDKLHGELMRLPIEEDPLPAGASLSDADRAELQRLFKVFFKERELVHPTLTTIRDDLAAHQPFLPPEQQVDLWGRLDPETYEAVMKSIPPIWHFARKLSIYAWTASPAPGVIVLSIPMVPGSDTSLPAQIPTPPPSTET